MKTILFSFSLLVAGLSVNAQALYIAGDNNSATTEIYVNGQDGSNPTLYVNGDLTVSNGKIDNASGLVWIAGEYIVHFKHKWRLCFYRSTCIQWWYIPNH